MQAMVSCDYFHTPAIFQVSDNLVFVGDIGNAALKTYARDLQFKSKVIIYHILWHGTFG
jgi:hypothetical protein